MMLLLFMKRPQSQWWSVKGRLRTAENKGSMKITLVVYNSNITYFNVQWPQVLLLARGRPICTKLASKASKKNDDVI